MAKKTSVQFYYEYIEQLQDLDDKQFRKVLEAMVIYDETEEIIELDSITKMAFNFIKKRIDYDKDTYNKKCEKNRQNIQNYWNERKQNDTNEYERIPMNTKNTDIDIELDLDKDLDNNKKENIKRKYGEFENVLLTDKEYAELEKSNLLPYIEEVSSYVASTGKRYKSHYATILNWEKRDKKKKQESKNKGLSFKEQQHLREQEILDKFVRGEI